MTVLPIIAKPAPAIAGKLSSTLFLEAPWRNQSIMR
jgi:hypothetical protein